ncbi:MAG: hypothetical protein DRZ76_03655 [Candidatus Nealsonbacteria bacterium]|nr:MAG: hypothetical protein DRZ76_03655 [Candidatus Nealsonbacteria bacterium]
MNKKAVIRVLSASSGVVLLAVLILIINTKQSPANSGVVSRSDQDEKTGEQYCTKIGTDYKLSLFRAKEIGAGSECGSDYAQNYSCNEITGTWWIDLNLEKPGCNPACVVDVVNETAEINWRCTGLVP